MAGEGRIIQINGLGAQTRFQHSYNKEPCICLNMVLKLVQKYVDNLWSFPSIHLAKRKETKTAVAEWPTCTSASLFEYHIKTYTRFWVIQLCGNLGHKCPVQWIWQSSQNIARLNFMIKIQYFEPLWSWKSLKKLIEKYLSKTRTFSPNPGAVVCISV